ncbi:MAG: WD40 repeat protein/energy-coupling factor transporter ATP-binding protein EcfA2 [Cyclobacteriaceae bacterium]|jgi:WD40 repeat protein/energy-coupling factor transporter ATP-binding protein EcfA2
MSEKEIKAKSELSAVSISQLVDPFPGLRPFGIEESHLFFGREGQSDEVLMKLAENKFVAILGASGSGKSSLMYCGLIPTLYGGFMAEAGSDWRIVVTRPGGGPIDNLAEALLDKDEIYNNLDEEDQLIRKTITSTVLRSSSLGLIEVIKQLKASDRQNVLILVDQFEELFRYKKLETLSSDLDESSAFVNLLLEAVHQYDAPVYVALTMRSDFIGDCASFPDLTQMINDSHYLIPQMTRDQKRLAIEGPVAVGGGKIAPRLTQQLLNDIGDNPDQLPIVQHALMRTWAFWKENKKENEPIDLRHYNAIGTLREALSQHANEAYDSLSKREQQICEAMFKALTERGTESSGIRRPTKLATIAAIAGVNEEEVIRVVDKFREPGRTLLMPPHGVRIDSETVIDISHESLMRIWTRLKAWLDEESRSSEMYLKLAESAERFQLGRAGLWKMPDLQLALNWEEENKPTLVWGQRYEPAYERTIVFLETSKKAYDTEQRNKELLQKRALKRSRLTALFLAGVALVAIFAVVYANIQTVEADKQTLLAEKLAKDAEEQAKRSTRLAADAVEAQTKAEAAEKVAEEEKLKAQKAAETAIKAQAAALVAQKEAQANAELAKKAQDEAVKQGDEAKRQAAAAEVARQEALLAKADADDLRFQAIAQSMAIKSQKIKSNAEQQGNIARQGFLFYDQYKPEDKEYNADIYAGVYYALRELTKDTTQIGEAQYHRNQYDGHEGAVRSVVYSQDGKTLYSAGSDGMILKWNMADESKSFTVLDSTSVVNRVVDISSDEKWLALGSENFEVFIYNLNSPETEPKKVSGHAGAVFDMVFLPDSKGFIYTAGDGSIRKNDFSTNTIIAQVSSRVKTLSISPDGQRLAGGNEEGHIMLWDLANENQEKTLHRTENTPISSIEFSNDGKLLAFGDQTGNVTLWNLEKSIREKTFTGHESDITDLEFNKDDGLLASTSRDGTARLWIMADYNELPIELDDHGKGQESERWVWSVSFNPDGQSLVTGAGDAKIRAWPVKPNAMADEICNYVNQNMSQSTWEAYVAKNIPYQYACEGKAKHEEEAGQ